MNPILKYPGAKYRLAPWIVSMIPYHEVYLEPYFGSGAVFFRKTPSRIETINDLDEEVVNFFKVIRDSGEEFTKRLRLTPYARMEYEQAYVVNEQDDNIEKARKFAIRCWFGFGSGNRYKNGFRTSQQSVSPLPTKAWNNFVETLNDVTERLRYCQIESRPALKLLDMYDTSDVFIYLDPPYLPDIRKKYQYVHEMTRAEHIELLEKIVSHPAKILLSGYDSDLYREYLSDWYTCKRKTQAERGIVRQEVLWANYDMFTVNRKENQL